MGCSDSPSFETLLTELESLGKSSRSQIDSPLISNALEILKEMSCLSPGRSHRLYGRIIVPGKDLSFHPIEQVYFVDTATEYIPETESFPVHSEMSESLAHALAIQFLSALELGSDDDDLDDSLQMGEDFTKRVEGVLKEHDINYALNEFMANAVDAKATQFSLLVDERNYETSRVLSPKLAKLQQTPSLLIFNNALFTKEDFRGLRMIGQGGKNSDPDSIGRYGLGSLSLFHFTDVVQLISGDSFLVLDPSGEHLPRLNGRPRTALLRRLRDVGRRYPDQLSAFESVHGFSKAEPFYNGTLFRLPLRDNISALSSTVLRASDCLNLINDRYFGLAKDAMYFTELEHASARRRSSAGSIAEIWSVSAERPPSRKYCRKPDAPAKMFS
ncbi:hypothetical protein C8J57DRAFT_661981 [Mycena rebaudengoi]|nr:hypothetical protein C8J57DRAFT_661981 [Mycena rebaudengoi]